MRKLSLSEWASVAEIAGTVGVVVSLLMVVYSLDRNTLATSAAGVNEIYDAYREIQLVLLADRDLVRITYQGQDDPGSLSEAESQIFWTYAAMNLDLWDRMLTRQRQGLIDAATSEPWDLYFREWTRRNITRAQWEDEKWGWPNRPFQDMVEKVLDH